MRFTRLLLLALVAGLIAVPAGLAQAETFHSVERVPFDIEAFSECTFEDIDVEGTLLVNSQITFDAQGGAHFHLTLAASDVSGTTAAGERVRYVFTDIFQDSFNFNGADTFTSNLNQILVAQGPNNNSYLDFTFHFTITPDGKFTGFVGNVRAGCR